MATSTYSNKRDFSRSPEPRGKDGHRRKHKAPVFVIQKHDATTLHYDFRLEVDGVLKSWAVPRGPSTDPSERRLAIPTEDHPLDYADFEGTIPAGQYGGGTVLLWDRGSYDNITEKDGGTVPLGRAIQDGHALVWLHGEKLTGGYALQRTGKQKNARWLLVKMDDQAADARRNPVSTQPDSVLTGRGLKEIAQEGGDESG
jgi:DNA ligase D-like protein (predicted 3'-phosphoesterase)